MGYMTAHIPIANSFTTIIYLITQTPNNLIVVITAMKSDPYPSFFAGKSSCLDIVQSYYQNSFSIVKLLSKRTCQDGELSYQPIDGKEYGNVLTFERANNIVIPSE